MVVETRRKGIRLYFKDSRVSEVLDADDIVVKIEVYKVKKDCKDIATHKIDDVVAFKYVDLGPARSV